MARGSHGLPQGATQTTALRMDEQRYLINGRIFAAEEPGLQEALARIHGTPARPRCLCVGGGVEMYVSKFKDFLIKRMPETGAEHRPTCPSYEPPASESGLGEVLGEAIIERGPDGVELRLDFPLTRRIGRSSAAEELHPPGEVTMARKQLSLRGLLHYLWERAGTATADRIIARVHRWRPAPAPPSPVMVRPANLAVAVMSPWPPARLSRRRH